MHPSVQSTHWPMATRAPCKQHLGTDKQDLQGRASELAGGGANPTRAREATPPSPALVHGSHGSLSLPRESVLYAAVPEARERLQDGVGSCSICADSGYQWASLASSAVVSLVCAVERAPSCSIQAATYSTAPDLWLRAGHSQRLCFTCSGDQKSVPYPVPRSLGIWASTCPRISASRALGWNLPTEALGWETEALVAPAIQQAMA